MGSRSETVQTNEPWDEASPYIKEGLNDAVDLKRRGGFQVDPFEGNALGELNPLEYQGASGVLSSTGQLAQFADQGAATASNVSQSPLFDGRTDAILNSMSGPAYSDDLANRLRRNVRENVMPGINSAFAGSGMANSGLHAQNLAKGLGAGTAEVEARLIDQAQNRQMSAAQLAQQGYTQGQGMRLNAAQAAPKFMQQKRDAFGKLGELGQRYTGRADVERQSEIQRFYQDQVKELDAVKNYLALTSGLGGQFGTSVSTTYQPMNPMSILGGLFQGASLFPGISDERTKENKRKVGKTNAGVPIYTYNYIGDPTQRMGVMAQELAKTQPEAVADLGGIKAVHYNEVK